MSQKLFSTEFFTCLIASETSNRFSLSDYFENAYSREYDFCDALPYEFVTKVYLSHHPSPTSRQISKRCAFSTQQRALESSSVRMQMASMPDMT